MDTFGQGRLQQVSALRDSAGDRPREVPDEFSAGRNRHNGFCDVMSRSAPHIDCEDISVPSCIRNVESESGGLRNRRSRGGDRPWDRPDGSVASYCRIEEAKRSAGAPVRSAESSDESRASDPPARAVVTQHWADAIRASRTIRADGECDEACARCCDGSGGTVEGSEEGSHAVIGDPEQCRAVSRVQVLAETLDRRERTEDPGAAGSDAIDPQRRERLRSERDRGLDCA